MMKRFVSVLAALLVSLGLAAGPARAADAPRVRLVTNLGDIVIQLDPEHAPKTVENFLAYVKSGFYSGTIFHRVIREFMIQGGGFTREFKRKPTRAPIRNEADNGLSNLTGTVAMARLDEPHTATSQFFVNTGDNTPLDHRGNSDREYGYAVFGKVVSGMDVVRKIESLPTYSFGPYENVPRSDAVIEKAEIIAP